jgi:hypothetical protein
MPSAVVGRTVRKGTYVIFDHSDPLAIVDSDPAGTDKAVLKAVSAAGVARVIYNKDQVTVYKLSRAVSVAAPGR